MNVKIEYDEVKNLYIIDDNISIVFISPEDFKKIYQQFLNMEGING